MLALLLMQLALATCSQSPSPELSPLIVNEIMYAPLAPEPEWVELLNPLMTPVDIRNWSIRDNSSGSGHVIVTATLEIQPGELIVLTRDPDALLMARPGITVPVISVSGFPSLNNTGDAVVLTDASGVVVDSLFYAPSWGGGNRTSLERIDPLSRSTDPDNWSSCTDPAGATPGLGNSIALLDVDLSLAVSETIAVRSGEPAMLSVQVQNSGKEDVAGYTVGYFEDLNHDGRPDPEETITRVESPGPIVRGSTMTISFRWDIPVAGTHFMLASVECAGDQRTGNNIASFLLIAGFPSRAVVVNEIMYDPLPDQAEYVELINRSGGIIDVGGWEISDRPTARGSVNTYRIPDGVAGVPDGGVFVIGSDSSLVTQFDNVQSYAIMNTSSLGLNNDGDNVLLRDPSGSLVDSVAYDPYWHNPDVQDTKGRALERISPSGESNDERNWSTCTLPIGGTPGNRNSLYTSVTPSAAQLSFSPNPFSPDGDGYQDFVVVHLDLPMRAGVINIRIFDLRGRLIRRLANAEPAGAHGDFIWDGRDDSRSLARIGMYVVLVEAIDDRGGLLATARGVVVLARQLR